MLKDAQAAKTAILRGFPKLQMLVVGDLMLDRYLIGSVARISPEAPVPVVKLDRSEASLGGAANLANNVARLGAQTYLAGVVGEDEGGSELAELASRADIDVTGFVAGERPTTVKTRIFAEHQQLLRIDEEDNQPIESATAKLLLNRIEIILGANPIDAILLSDYAKGVCTPEFCAGLMVLAAKREVPVYVDPKGLDYDKYRGATSLKPNRAELTAVAAKRGWNPDDLVGSAAKLRSQLGLRFVAVTLGPLGILAASEEGSLQAPARSMQVYDVSGAGDTALAAMACALCAGLSLPDSLALANLAAGEVVQKVGSVPIESGELLVALHASGRSTEDRKVFDLEDLVDLTNAWRAKGLRIAFTNGCFDLIHAGHVALLDSVAREADRLVVGLNSDASIRRLKGESRPLMPREQRLAVISALESVDAVVVFEEDDPLRVIEALKPDVLAKGSDYAKVNVVGADFVEKYGGKVILVSIQHQVSSSALAEALSKL